MNLIDPFESVVSEFYQPLYRFAMSLTHTECDAWDLTQQTFYIWATKGHQLRDHAKIKTWLFTTLYRAFLESKKRQHRFSSIELEEGLSEDLPSTAPNPDAVANSSDALPALARVDEIYQAPVALYYLEGYTYKEIAAILAVPIGTVKSRLARGIEQLRKIFRPDMAMHGAPNENQVPAYSRNRFRILELSFKSQPSDFQEEPG